MTNNIGKCVCLYEYIYNLKASNSNIHINWISHGNAEPLLNYYIIEFASLFQTNIIQASEIMPSVDDDWCFTAIFVHMVG